MKEEIDPYELLRRVLDLWPIRAPKSKEIITTLQEIYTTEEAKLLSLFKSPFTDRISPKELSDRREVPEERVNEILNSLAERGLVFRLGKSKKRAKYAVWPFVLGLYEVFFSNIKIWPKEKQKSVAENFENYYDRYFLSVAGASSYPFSRVLPSNTAEKILQIDKEVEGATQRVLAIEEIESLLDQYVSYGVMPCSCQVEHDILGDSCDKPKETCLTFDIIAEFMIDVGIARRLSKEEAIRLLKKYEKSGLVHMTLNTQVPNFICNCCRDCCAILKSISKFHRPRMFASSNFRAIIDHDVDCHECYKCFEVCPTRAIFPKIELNKQSQFEINQDLCIGCGLCSSNCLIKKIKLSKIKHEIPEKTTPDAYIKYARERFSYKLN
jgi:electron transport complex protein RnfB